MSREGFYFDVCVEEIDACARVGEGVHFAVCVEEIDACVRVCECVCALMSIQIDISKSLYLVSEILKNFFI